MAGTYLAVKPDGFAIADIQKIQKAAQFANPIAKEKLHCTLMYSKEAEGNGYVPNPDAVYEGIVTGCEMLGEVGSPYRALVLTFDCPALTRRFNYAKTKGLIHSYPNFKPHISLAYGDDVEGHMLDVQEYLDAKPQIKLNFTNEYSEPLVDD